MQDKKSVNKDAFIKLFNKMLEKADVDHIDYRPVDFRASVVENITVPVINLEEKILNKTYTDETDTLKYEMMIITEEPEFPTSKIPPDYKPCYIFFNRICLDITREEYEELFNKVHDKVKTLRFEKLMKGQEEDLKMLDTVLKINEINQ